MRGTPSEADRQLERLFRVGTVGGLSDGQPDSPPGKSHPRPPEWSAGEQMPPT